MRKVKSFKVLAKNSSRYILLASLLFVNLLTRAQAVDSTTTAVTDSTTASNIPIAQGDLEDPVFYESFDSIVYDAANKRLLLYRNAQIKYQDIVVDASFIEYEQDSSTMSAKALQSAQDSVDKHLLTKGEEKTKFKELRFNFKSQRAVLSNAYSQYGEGFIKSKRIKRNKDQSIYGLHNIYTTCNLEHPHFGIAAKKVKIIPKKVAVSGSANLVIEDIPTPLYLPFGLFPLKKGQRSGFRLPSYDMSQNLGFGLRGGGYYFAINDHLDLLALTDIYSLGTYRLGVINNYNWRYRFKGNLQFDYAYNKIGNEFENSASNTSKNFIFKWSHQIDQNVKPGTGFSANVTLGTSRYYTNNSYDASRYLNNNYSSSINYSKNWAGTPFNLSVSARHSQNTQTRVVNITLPEINLSANQLYPFKFRKDVIKPRWYEKITASYQMAAVNEYEFIDTQLNFQTMQLNDFNNGIKHSIPITATYNLFKYINANFTASYNEYWFSKKLFQSFDFQNQRLDSVQTNGFFTARDYTVNAGFSTRIYGIKLLKKGRISGIRHLMTPRVSFQYRPDFGLPRYGNYYESYSSANFNRDSYSYYQGQPFGGPPTGEIGGIGFYLGNNLQFKIRSKDTAQEDQKVNIIDGLDFSAFYNIAADSFNWSNVNMNYRTTLFKKVNITGSASYSPYGIDTITAKRSKEYNINTNNKLLRFERANIALGASFPLNRNKKKKQQSDDEMVNSGFDYGNYVDFNIPFTLRVNYNLRFNRNYAIDKTTKLYKDSLGMGQDLNFSGDVNLTPRWKIGVQSGYDFINKNLTFTSIDIFRDLHCWEMRINVVPFGFRKSYNFSLNVKAQVLQDLKLVRRKDFRDNF